MWHLARNVTYSVVSISSSLLNITSYPSVVRTQNIQSFSWRHSRVRLYIATHCFHGSGSWILILTMNTGSRGIGCCAQDFNKGENVARRCKKKLHNELYGCTLRQTLGGWIYGRKRQPACERGKRKRRISGTTSLAKSKNRRKERIDFSGCHKLMSKC